ncbi:MAG: isoprenylcysteine carboxylmethyltransferase family protein [Desulfosporosinus sp.]|nr:isoprenylcysteine carboxylmethyltransferase family protein [Desulfosporosinus sp.]
MKKLIIPTLRTFFLGSIMLGLLLFLPAWTLNYWQAWVFISVFMVSTNAIGVYLSIKDPTLLERRKNAGVAAEQRMPQKIFVVVVIVANVALLVCSALDHRFRWSQVPPYVSVVGNLLIVLAFIIFYFVFKENSYGASNVQTFDEQKVVSTGPYAYVRHPMYVGALVMIIGVPLALGSLWGLAILFVTLAGLVWRILDEEKLLMKDLPGYTEYMQKVRYRLIPYLW